MYVIFDGSDSPARASLTKSEAKGDLSFEITRELYLEIMGNPFVLKELTLVRRDGMAIVERLTNIPRSNQTMLPVPMGKDGDIVLAITWAGMRMEYAPHIRKASTHEFLFCIGSMLNPLCDPVKLSHGTTVQMEYILKEDKLPFRSELFKKASVFVSRPYTSFSYSYYLDF